MRSSLLLAETRAPYCFVLAACCFRDSRPPAFSKSVAGFGSKLASLGLDRAGPEPCFTRGGEYYWLEHCHYFYSDPDRRPAPTLQASPWCVGTMLGKLVSAAGAASLLLALALGWSRYQMSLVQRTDLR